MIFNWLLLLVPLSLALGYFVQPGPIWVFVCAILAVVPLAEWIRRATEHLAARATPAVGGLLNVTFGNTAEFILALFVLASGETGVVKAQITGSLIGNGCSGSVSRSWSAVGSASTRALNGNEPDCSPAF